MNKRITMISLIIMISILIGCATTQPVQKVEFSGFLSDYSLLKEGSEGQAARVYKNPNANFSAYNKILLDPIVAYRGSESKLRGVNREDLQHLTDYFFTVLYKKLSEDYEMVSHPQGGTLRIQVALTKYRESNVTLDVISTVVPQMRLISLGKDYLTDKPSFTGEAMVEARVTDATTGELLGAGVDRRVGGKTLNADSFNSWGDVEATMRFWTDRASYNLCVERSEGVCVSP